MRLKLALKYFHLKNNSFQFIINNNQKALRKTTTKTTTTLNNFFLYFFHKIHFTFFLKKLKARLLIHLFIATNVLSRVVVILFI